MTAVDSDQRSSASPGVGGVRSPAWSWRTALAAVFFVGFLAVQLIVPLLDVGPSRTRFGWKMFSSRYPAVRFSVESADGEVERIQYRPYTKHRLEVRYENHLPTHLCGQLPGAAAILVKVPNEAEPRRHVCR